MEYLNEKSYLPLSLIMGDVDSLKMVNDTLGHLKGDELLVKASNILKRVCKKDDLIVRWGGDEFIIILKNTSYEAANDLCIKIENECRKEKETQMPVSISLGCATKVNIDEDIDIILKEAEERLYKQKLLTKLNSRTSVVEELNETLKQKSIETKQHTNRVWHYAKRLGVKMGFEDSKIKDLEVVAQLHDIGKIGIEEYILSKPGKLTKEEFEIIKTHTEKGYRIAKINEDISHIANDILCHHERWDAKGYPLGLKGEEIPLLARIICIIDSYDAMTSERTYKVKMSKEEALDEIKRNSGTQFDPHIVDIFLKEFEN